MPDTKARKESRDRWNDRNPSSAVRLPREDYDELKDAAIAKGIGYHGLLKEIIQEWLATNRTL